MLAPKKCLGHLGTDKEHEFVPTRPNQLRCRPGCGRADLRKGDRHKPGTGDRRKDRRDRHKNKGDRHTNAIKTPKLERPFIAVDGEGAGTNEHGQQNYLLMRARGLDDSTRRSLFKDNRPLTTAECLEFILSLPRDAELVGFGIGYDVTMILRDLPPEKLRRLLKGQLHIDEDDQAEYRPPGRGLYSYTYWKDYAIMYVPQQFFRVARLCYDTKEHKQKVVERSSRCINEVRHSFQMPFAKVIDFWEVGDPETREMISRNKEKRAEFDAVTPEIQRYCEEECRLLAEVMTLFRAACIEAGARSGISLIPRNWRGAGGYAAAMHKSCGTPRKEQVKDSRPPEVEALAIEAFYGGRFEIPRTGLLPGPIFEYDIGSAHPAAMLQLPCPLHTQWHCVVPNKPRGKLRPPKNSLYVAEISFDHPSRNQQWSGFPFRNKDGRIHFPLRGSGVYWSPETEAAIQKLGAAVDFKTIWVAEKCCDCALYAWVRKVFEVRKELGKGTKGYSLKLALNSLYGKLAERIGGDGPYHDIVAAGLITAITRARLIDAIALDPAAIVMVAADAVYSTRELRALAPLGEGLGDWEPKVHGRMFVVQPGLYFFPDDDKPEKAYKTRGIPKSVVLQHKDNLMSAWQEWTDFVWTSYGAFLPSYPMFVSPEGVIDYGAMDLPMTLPIVRRGRDPKGRVDFPAVPMGINIFVGHRLALHWGEPDLAGCWTRLDKNVSFDWGAKRAEGKLYLQHGSVPECTAEPVGVPEEAIAKLMTAGKLADEFVAAPDCFSSVPPPEAAWFEHAPFKGDRALRSVPYDPSLNRPLTETELQSIEFEAYGDAVEIVEK